jgi:glycolate oxidase FAD binding subunit
MTKAIATQLESIINSDTELISLTDAAPYWQEKINKIIIDSTLPNYLVFPDTVDKLSAIIQEAQQQQWRIIPCGNGSKLDWGGLTKDIQLLVSTQKLNRIVEHAVGDLTVTVEAGVKLADLQATLNTTSQFLPIDPAYPATATIGGIVATADTGSWRQRYGGIRDMVLGLSFVRSDGKIAKAGGRVVKNVAGYDLMKLFTGSYGTLGIISQVTFRTYPQPEASTTILLTGEAEAIFQAVKTLRNSSLSPTAADLLSASVIKELGIGKETGLIVRFQTIPVSIEQQTTQLASIAKELNCQIQLYRDDDEIQLWQILSETIRIPSSDKAIICKIGVVPTQAVALLQKLTQITTNEVLGMIHIGSGIGQLQFKAETKEAIEATRSHLEQNHGFLTILTSTSSLKQQLDPWGYSGNALTMMKTIKQKFDPNNIFSPSRLIINN